MLKKILLLVIITLLLLIVIEGEYSYSFVFAPPVIEMSARTGETKEFKLTLLNDHKEELLCKLYITDIKKTKEGHLLFPQPNTTDYSCSGYINLGNTEVILAPGELKEITCQMKIPYLASAGGKYAVIMCEPRPKDIPESVLEANPRWRLGCIVKLLIEGMITKRINVKELKFNPATEEKPRNISFVIENKSNILISKGKGFLTIIDAKKRVVDRVSLNLESTIYPQTELIFEVSPKRYLTAGSYTATILVDYGDIRAYSEELTFSITEEEKELQQKQAKPVFGQLITVSVEPKEINVDLPAGAFRSYTIKLNNQEETKLDVEVELCDVVSISTGKLQYIKFGNTDYTLSGILSINPRKFSILPRSTKIVNAIFKLPSSEKLHTSVFYGGILFNFKASTEDFTLEDKLEVNVSLSIKDKLKEVCGSITEVCIKKASGEHIVFEVYFKNTGNTALTPVSLSITIKDRLFNEVLQMTDEIDYLMPGQIHKFILEHKFSEEKKLKDGQYFAYIKVNFSKDKYEKVEKEFKIKK